MSDYATYIFADRFDEQGVLHLTALGYHGNEPIRVAFMSGGFSFCSASFLQEVPYDPWLYFTGEEPALSVRAFTWGWDIYSPHQCFINHRFDRPDAKRHWDDNPQWWVRHNFAVKRIDHLLNAARADDPKVTVGLNRWWGLGTVRTLEQFEEFAGVSFQTQTIMPWVRSQRPGSVSERLAFTG